MNNDTNRIMKGLVRRLDRLSELEVTACGHESNLAEADHYRKDMLKWMRGKIEQLEPEKTFTIQTSGGPLTVYTRKP